MGKSLIQSDEAPRAIGPYSQAVLENFRYRLELSGQLGISPETGKMVDGGLVPQARQSLANISGILRELDWNLDNLTKVRIYVLDSDDEKYQELNRVYEEVAGKAIPARAVVGVSWLPTRKAGSLVEFDCTAGGDNIPEAARKKYSID